MRRKTHRFTALLCAFCMLFTSIPSSVMSDSIAEESWMTAATPTDLQPAVEEEAFPNTDGKPETQDSDRGMSDTGNSEQETGAQSEAEPENETPENNEQETETPDEPVPEKPQADRELEAGDDLTITGELEGDPPQDYLIRFTPEKNQTMVLILTADKELKATVRNESTSDERSLVKDHTNEDGTITWTVTDYRTEKENTYLLQISAEKQADFSLRLVRKSIYEQEQKAEESTEKSTEEAGDEPAEQPTNEAGEEPGEELGEPVDEEPGELTTDENAEDSAEEFAETPDEEPAEETSDETPDDTETDQQDAPETTEEASTGDPETEPEQEKPEADQEITAGDDITATGEMNASGEYLIRFTPDMDQTLYLILTAENVEATVTDELTGSTKPFTPDSTVEEEQTVMTVPFYKIKNGNSYLIRISGTGAFTVRLVRSSILKAEANREDEPDETTDSKTEPAEEPEEIPAETEPEVFETDQSDEPAKEENETPATWTESEATAEAETPATQTDLEYAEEETPATQTDLEPVEIRIDATDSDIEAYILFLSNAGIQEGTELQVRELTPEEQEAYQRQTAQALNAEDESYLRYTKYLEFTLVHDGWAIPLNAPAKVYVTLPDISEGADALQVVRFDNMAPVLLDSERTENTVSFETEGFDVFGIGNALVPVTDHETDLVKVEVLSFSEDAPVNLTEAEAPEVIEGLEVLGTFTIEENTEVLPEAESQDSLFIKAELKEDAELDPMEGVALYSVDEDGNTEILMEQLTEDAKITELEANQVAVIKDTGYRHLTLTVNPDETTEDQIVTLDGMMPKDAEATVTEVTVEHAAANNMEIAESNMADESEETSESAEIEEDTDPDSTKAVPGTINTETPEEDTETTKETETEEEPEEEPAEEESKVKLIAAYDITILNGTDEYQPDEEKPIQVEILDSRITTDQNIKLWHIKDDGTEEQIEEFTVETGKICFIAIGFSVYSIVMDDREDYVPEGEATAVTFEDIENLGGSGFIIYTMAYKAGATSENQYLSNVIQENVRESGRNGIRADKSAEDAAIYFFEKVSEGDGYAEYYIYTDVEDDNDVTTRKYLRMEAKGNAGRGSLKLVEDSSQKTPFRFYIRHNENYSSPMDGFTSYSNGFYMNRNMNTSGGDGNLNKNVLVGWQYDEEGYYDGGANQDTKKVDNNTAFLILKRKATEYPDDPYHLVDNGPYGIVYHNEDISADAMTDMTNSGKLVAKDLAVRPDIIDNDGIMLVSQYSDITQWTFECVEENKYHIITPDGRYLTMNGANLSLEDAVDPDGKSSFTATPGTGVNKGKWHFTIGNYALSLKDGAFKGAALTEAGSWLNLVKKSDTLTDDDFILYNAKKVNVSDRTEVVNGNQYILYTRIWNDTTKEYEFYAVNHNGKLFRCYESGDHIMWYGSQINTALWEFTEYKDAVSEEPNGYYELQNTYSGKYIVPTLSGQDVLQDRTIGVNLSGRENGVGYTTIQAWDKTFYNYAGVRVDDEGQDKIISCPIQEADVFLFAVMEPTSEELTTVATVDNNKFGITLKMSNYEYTGPYNGSKRQSTQCQLLGVDTNGAGLVQPYLTDGFPVSSNGSLKPLFDDSGSLTTTQTANHLFLQSIYNESGYFEFDSTQNYAYLNGGNFTVYNQLGTSNGHSSNSMKHGQFFPYNTLEGRSFSTKYYNTTSRTNAELPDSNPRKYEKMYNIDDVDYFFGMELSASFTQTPSGKDAWGHDIIFEFSGDDDMWFFVDDYLVLDLGGVHSAMGGTVNFRTGTISGNRGSGAVTTLKDAFEAGFIAKYKSEHGSEPDQTTINNYLDEIFTSVTINGETHYVFKDYTNHTMKMFYMERGAGSSNLRLRMNLTAVEKGHVLLTKQVSGSDLESLNGIEYPFQIYYWDMDDTAQNKWKQLIDNPDEHNYYVIYRNTEEHVTFKKEATIDGQQYENVYYLKPGQTADIHVPNDMIYYYIRECGVDTRVYNGVKINGIDITNPAEDPGFPGLSYWSGDNDGYQNAGDNSKEYRTKVDTVEKRPVLVFDNEINPNALHTLTISKALLNEDNNWLSATQDPNLFKYRLYFGTEKEETSGGSGSGEGEQTQNEITYSLSYLQAYYVKDPAGNYCKWNSTDGKFESTGIKDFSALRRAVDAGTYTDKQVKFATSPNGAIDSIPTGYSVEIRDLLIGTKFKVEEWASDIPLGYTCKGMTEELTKTPQNSSSSYTGEILTADKTVYVINKRGCNISIEKIWSDDDFVTGHGLTYVALYTDDTGSLVRAVDENNHVYPVKAINARKTASYYLENLLDIPFENYVVREVVLSGDTIHVDSDTNVVTGYSSIIPADEGDHLNLTARMIGDENYSMYEYVVKYEQGTPTSSVTAAGVGTETRPINLRHDYITNNRTGGLKIRKTDMEGHPLPGAVFRLVRLFEDGSEPLEIGIYTTNSQGLITTRNLRDEDGATYFSKTTYELTEIVTPNNYHNIAETIEIELLDHGTYEIETGEGYSFTPATLSELPTLTIQNKPVTLQLKKTGTGGNPLAGAHFALYRQVKGVNQNGAEINRKDYLPMEGYEDIITGNDGIILSTDQARTLSKGTYFLTETQAPENHSGLESDLVFTIGELGIVTVDSGGHSSYLHKTEDSEVIEYSVDIPNEQIDMQPPYLYVSKTVEGDLGDRTKPFTFTVSGISNLADCSYYKYYYTRENGVGNWIQGEGEEGRGILHITNGETSFELKHNEMIQIAIPDGSTLNVAEEEAENYETDYEKYIIDRATEAIDESSRENGNDRQINIEINTNHVRIDFTNTYSKEMIVAPTGLRGRKAPYAILLMIGTLLLITCGFGIAKRKQKEPDVFDSGQGRQRARNGPNARGDPKGIPRGRGDPPCPRMNLWIQSEGSLGERGDPGG